MIKGNDQTRSSDMTSQNAQTGLSIYSAWEARDFDNVVSRMSDDVIFVDKPRGTVARGRDETRTWYATWAEACPHSVVNATLVGESDDTVVIEGVWEGTNDGPLGSLPPTGRRVSLPFINVLRFGRDGRVVEGAAFYDQLTLLIQLGHAQSPA
jgi:steroid delta-isomerase-like uncharacterized protein